MKRLANLLLAVLTVLTLVLTAGAEPYVEYTSGDLNAAQPSKREIREKYFSITQAEYLYDEKPSYTAPYATGKLSDSFLQSGLDYLNYVRYVAKLPDVELDPALNENAQYGAVLLAALGGLSHTPTQPEDMDDDFYSQGYEATSSSNISYIPTSLLGARKGLRESIQGCIQDTGSVQNYSCVGHRRWLLNPVLGKVGFGYVLNTSFSLWDEGYALTKVFDKSGEGCDYDFISWPASGNFPTELFDQDASWSVTVNPEKYQFPNREDLTVQITRYSDGLTWVFDKNSPASYESGKSYLLTDGNGYGVRNCIIFRPAIDFFGEYEGGYWVCISGLKTLDGEDAMISFDVDFFDLEQPDCEACSYQGTVTEPSCTERGYTTYPCSVCGYRYQDDWTEPLGHTYDDHLCIRCGELEEGYYGHGMAGDNVTWTLDYAGNLTFSGYGDMYDYSDWTGDNPAPWSNYQSLIKTVTMDDGITSLSDNAFGYCRKLTDVDLSEGLTRIGSDAFSVCEGLTTLTIPDGVTSIGQWAFSNCSSLTGLELPQGITAIESGTFINCGALEALEIPESVTSIGSSAFYGCAALTQITIPEGVTELASGVFQGCTGLENVELPDSLTEIGYHAFKDCTSLQHLDLPEDLETVNYEIFSGSGIQSVTFHGPAPQYISPDAFQGVTVQIFYPAGDSTWTEEVRGQYGGTLTWIPSEELPSHNWLPKLCDQPLTCADCGMTFGRVQEHLMPGWSPVRSASCTEPGLEQQTCDRCGYVETRETSPSHSPIWEWVDASCEEPGHFRGVCVSCGDTQYSGYEDPLGHDIEALTVSPSCAQEGSEYRKCTRCDFEETITLPKLDHDIEEYDQLSDCEDGGTHYRKCRNCAFEEAEPVAPAEHEFHTVTQVYPTCTKQGSITRECSRCSVTRTNILEPLGHDYVEEYFLEPTCEDNGLLVQACTNCQATITTVKAPLYHSVVITVLTDPTCTERGQNQMDCTRCAYSKTVYTPITGHSYVSETTAATCTAAGGTVERCLVCGDSQIISTADPLGHRWSDGRCMDCGMTTGQSEPVFTDVVSGSYYELPVNWAVSRGITTGTSATTFSPEEPCTRGQVVTFLWRAAGSPEPVSSDNPFTDVAESDYFYKAVLWAVENGITKGVSDTSFAPGQPCTRAQVATFLWRAAGEPEPATQTHSFTDIEKEYYYDAVLWAVGYGITNGTSDTTFSPASTCTRAQIVTFLYRFLA